MRICDSNDESSDSYPKSRQNSIRKMWYYTWKMTKRLVSSFIISFVMISLSIMPNKIRCGYTTVKDDRRVKTTVTWTIENYIFVLTRIQSLFIYEPMVQAQP